MSEKIWIEWIGLWGAGKTTFINEISNDSFLSKYSINSTRTFFEKSRYTKLKNTLKISPASFIMLLSFLYICTPIYLRAYFKNDTIVLGELRSFLSCYMARLSMANAKDYGVTLWEGEFHLLPIFSLEDKVIDKLINNFLLINKDRTNVFVFLNVDIETVKNRILKDQNTEKNIRFKLAQKDLFFGFLNKFNANQNNLINKLRERGEIVYESTGGLGEMKNFITKLKEDMFPPAVETTFENHFLCVGAQRAGTTTFFNMIKNHPDIAMSSSKEVHYFDIDENYNQGHKWYLSHFNEDNKSVLKGECTPDYLIYSYVPQRIKETLGENVKLIFILRNPIERAYSQFNFHIMQGVESRADFYEVINKEVIDKENKVYNTWHEPQYYLSRRLYYNQIKRYLELFPRDNMHFVLFEDLFGENQNFYFNEILDFIGADDYDISDYDRENNSKTQVPFNWISNFLHQALWRGNKLFAKPTKAILTENLYLLMRQKISVRLREPRTLSKEKKIELNRKFFSEDISKLQKLLKKDFSSWLS